MPLGGSPAGRTVQLERLSIVRLIHSVAVVRQIHGICAKGVTIFWSEKFCNNVGNILQRTFELHNNMFRGHDVNCSN